MVPGRLSHDLIIGSLLSEIPYTVKVAPMSKYWLGSRSKHFASYTLSVVIVPWSFAGFQALFDPQ